MKYAHNYDPVIMIQDRVALAPHLDTWKGGRRFGTLVQAVINLNERGGVENTLEVRADDGTLLTLKPWEVLGSVRTNGQPQLEYDLLVTTGDHVVLASDLGEDYPWMAGHWFGVVESMTFFADTGAVATICVKVNGGSADLLPENILGAIPARDVDAVLARSEGDC